MKKCELQDLSPDPNGTRLSTFLWWSPFRKRGQPKRQTGSNCGTIRPWPILPPIPESYGDLTKSTKNRLTSCHSGQESHCNIFRHSSYRQSGKNKPAEQTHSRHAICFSLRSITRSPSRNTLARLFKRATFREWIYRVQCKEQTA